MKTMNLFIIGLAILIVAFAFTALAQQKSTMLQKGTNIVKDKPISIVLPKGTKVEVLGTKSFKFIFPDGRYLVIKDFSYNRKTATGAIGVCEIYDQNDKLIAKGKQAKIKAITKAAAQNVPPTDFIKIDDDTVWLPVTIVFSSLDVKDRDGLRGLSPQPDPPGKR